MTARAYLPALQMESKNCRVHLRRIPWHRSNTRAQTDNQAYSEYKHVLANILRSLFVARTLPVEARSPDCRSDVENAPVGGGPAARPAGRSHYVVISRDGRKLVTRVRVMLP